ncbi:MAG: hypothetical protein DRP82_06015 [Planctomycetota bacterium]|nr:MAG: hypothetical protein DRP82_06015 [Planctomycetota bacterium]
MLTVGVALTPVRAAGARIGDICEHRKDGIVPVLPARLFGDQNDAEMRLLALCVPSLRGGLAWVASLTEILRFCDKAGLQPPPSPQNGVLLCSKDAIELDATALLGAATVQIEQDKTVAKLCETLASRIPFDETAKEMFLGGFCVCTEERWRQVWFCCRFLEARQAEGKVHFEEWIPPLSVLWGDMDRTGLMRVGEGETLARGWLELVEVRVEGD